MNKLMPCVWLLIGALEVFRLRFRICTCVRIRVCVSSSPSEGRRVLKQYNIPEACNTIKTFEIARCSKAKIHRLKLQQNITTLKKMIYAECMDISICMPTYLPTHTTHLPIFPSIRIYLLTYIP